MLKFTRVLCLICVHRQCPWGDDRVLSAFFLRNQFMILDEEAPVWLRPCFAEGGPGSTRPSVLALFSSTDSVRL